MFDFHKYKSSIKSISDSHNVKSLKVFGSSISDKFNEKSDIDIIVEFNKVPLPEYSKNYFSLKRSLEKLFGRDIDLLEKQAIKNPYFNKAINNNLRSIYG